MGLSPLATSWKTSYIPYTCTKNILHVCNKPTRVQCAIYSHTRIQTV
jgi:hypothetical protein